jgi:probable O-glycosylation ligase (exosortase A-associated)
MRDLFIAFIIFGSVPIILMRPYIGMVMWYVVSLMNPHQMAYGFVTSMPVAMISGGATLLGFVAFREQKRFPVDNTTAMILAMMVWITVSSAFSIMPELAWADWNRSIKMFGMTLLMIPLLTNRQRLNGVLWAIVISIDIYGVRGGLFTLIVGNGGRVSGPPETMLGDNNQLAAALIMILPLLRYLHTQAADRYVRIGVMVAMGLTIISVFGSYSRGALIGLAVMFLWMLRSSRHKAAILLAAVFGVVMLAAVMPESWYARMNTIETYNDDDSATGRLDAWKFAFRLALQRPLVGGGFRVYADSPLFAQLVPEGAHARAFHSIYFEALGEHGFIGLAIFLAIIGAGFLKCAQLRKETRNDPQRTWVYELASMTQVSIVGYAASGAFLELTFLDLFYAIVILPTLAANVMVREDERVQHPQATARTTLPLRPARQIGIK